MTYKKIAAGVLVGAMLLTTLTGCKNSSENSLNNSITGEILNGEAVMPDSVSQLLEGVNSEAGKLEFSDREKKTDYAEGDCTKITFSGDNIDISGSGAAVSGNTVTITEGGDYIISGILKDGVLRVSCSDEDNIRLIFNGTEITSLSSAPVVIEKAKNAVITLVDGTVNSVSDSTRVNEEDEDYSAAITSKTDLCINGNGTLIVNADYRNGIKSSDDLKLLSGTYNINSNEDAVIGKDLLGIASGSFTINAGADGLKSTYDKDNSKGNIIIEGGDYTINAGNDGVQSENLLIIRDGSVNVKTGEGADDNMSSENNTLYENFEFKGDKFLNGNRNPYDTGASMGNNSETDSVSMKGLKGNGGLYISGGNITLDCEDDSIHSDKAINIKGGDITVSSGDDGIHADEAVSIDGGNITVSNSYEGIEGAQVVINDGNININASDDGMNASADTKTDMMISINGGDITVNAGGDGLDSNGSVVMTGGRCIVYGPVDDANTALDFESTFEFKGGVMMAFGSSGMLEIPTLADNGCCIVAAFTSKNAGSAFNLKDSGGNVILSDEPAKVYSSVILYSPDIKTQQSYTIVVGDTSIDITVEDNITTNGVSGGFSGGFGSMGHGGNKGQGNIGMPDGENAPDGMQMPDGGNAPDGMQMPDGGNAPDGMQMPDGGNAPDGMQMPNGGNASDEIKKK